MNLHIGEDSRQFLKILQDLLKTFWGSWQEPWWSLKIFVHLRDNFFKFSTSTTVLIIWVSPRFCALWHPHFLHKLWPHLKYKRISIYTEHNTSKLSLTKFPPLAFVPFITLSINILRRSFQEKNFYGALSIVVHIIRFPFGAHLHAELSSLLLERRPRTQRLQLLRMRCILPSGMHWTCAAWKTGSPWCVVGICHTVTLTALDMSCHDNIHNSKTLSCSLPLRPPVDPVPSHLPPGLHQCHAVLPSMSRVPVS